MEQVVVCFDFSADTFQSNWKRYGDHQQKEQMIAIIKLCKMKKQTPVANSVN